jgi:hypothetical protein
MAKDFAIKLNQGADYELRLRIRDANGDPVDLTDHDFAGQIRLTPQDDEVIGEFVFDKGDQSDPDEIGLVRVLIPAADSEDFPSQVQRGECRLDTIFFYDIESMDDFAIVRRWLQGKVIMSPEVTRDAV